MKKPYAHWSKWRVSIILLAVLLVVALPVVVQGREGLDFGDAPEAALAYPSTGVVGAFPTCYNVPTAGWIQHTNFGAYFGPRVDFEPEGNAGLCPLFNPNSYDQDECFNDGDAGLIVPEPYTIQGPVGSEVVVPCANSTGTPLGNVCQTAVWGVNVDINVTNNMPSETLGYLNVLMDWNQNGQWGDIENCPTMGSAPEHVLVNFVVPNPYSGPLSSLGPPTFLIGPNSGYVWTRFTISEDPVPQDWKGEGDFEDGETEDYLLRVDQPTPPPVGGEAYMVNKTGLLAPWLGLAALIVAAIAVVAIRRRRPA